MPPESSDPVLGAMLLALAATSIGTWFWLFDRLKHGPILPYESRPPVPWHGVWTLLPVLLVAFTVFAAFRGDDHAEDAEPATATDLVDRIALGSAQQTAFVVAFLAVVIAVSGATREDLGLPKDGRQLARDVGIGILAWLAALAPVYGAQFLMISFMGPTEGHPLIKIVQENASPLLYILAFAAAVVVAPVCEELLFRLLLQGWLEKWEDRRLGWRTPAATLAEDCESAETPDIAGEESPLAVPGAPEEPPRDGPDGLPYGWLPIALSSLLFGLAHIGYGPEPVPLFLLALILGYVYQRTHRIVPCMVTHALFNGTSLVALWRVMSAGAP
jgi:membrane protease YdiL (CAAX protease family)